MDYVLSKSGVVQLYPWAAREEERRSPKRPRETLRSRKKLRWFAPKARKVEKSKNWTLKTSHELNKRSQ